jgi:carbon monoxide dehydrogenase subunit G
VKLSHTITIAAPAEKVWAAVMDIPTAARCLPGVAAVNPAGADKFNGSLLVQIGPVRLVLDGEIAVAARDDANRRASLRASAKDSRVGGTVRSTVDLALRDVPQGCELRIDSDVQIGGRIGEFGQPVIQRKADQLLAQFAACLGRTAAG